MPPPKILIVEDSIVSWVMMEAHIKRKNPDFDVRVRHSLRGGFEEFDRFAPNLVILDLTLPDSPQGTEALAAIPILRKRGAGVLAVSGHLDMEKASLAAGANDFAGKSVGSTSTTTFMERITALLPACLSS